MTNKDFFAALEDLEREKGISRQIFIDALQNALVAAYKKHTGDPSEIVVKMDDEKHTINFYSVKTVVATEDENAALPISIVQPLINFAETLPRKRNPAESLP